MTPLPATTPTMKWTCTPDGQWVRRCFELTITPTGKSDKPSRKETK